MSARRGSHRMERLPRARGPHSMRPWNQPTTWPSAMRKAVRRQSSSGSFDPPDRAARGLEGGAVVRDLGLDGTVLERGPQIGVLHDVTAWPLEHAVPDGEGGADRAAGIACGGLDVEVGEGSSLEDLTVRDRVHGAAAR